MLMFTTLPVFNCMFTHLSKSYRVLGATGNTFEKSDEQFVLTLQRQKPCVFGACGGTMRECLVDCPWEKPYFMQKRDMCNKLPTYVVVNAEHSKHRDRLSWLYN